MKRSGIVKLKRAKTISLFLCVAFYRFELGAGRLVASTQAGHGTRATPRSVSLDSCRDYRPRGRGWAARGLFRGAICAPQPGLNYGFISGREGQSTGKGTISNVS